MPYGLVLGSCYQNREYCSQENKIKQNDCPPSHIPKCGAPQEGHVASTEGPRSVPQLSQSYAKGFQNPWLGGVEEQHAGVAGPPAKRCSPSWLLFGAAGREKGQGRNWQRFLTGLGFTSRQILQPLGLFTPATDKTGTWPQDFKIIPYFIFYLKNKQANQHKRTRQPNFSVKHFALGINLIKNLFTPLSYA